MSPPGTANTVTLGWPILNMPHHGSIVFDTEIHALIDCRIVLCALHGHASDLWDSRAAISTIITTTSLLTRARRTQAFGGGADAAPSLPNIGARMVVRARALRRQGGKWNTAAGRTKIKRL